MQKPTSDFDITSQSMDIHWIFQLSFVIKLNKVEWAVSKEAKREATSAPCRVEFGNSRSRSSLLLLSKTGFRKDSQFVAASLSARKTNFWPGIFRQKCEKFVPLSFLAAAGTKKEKRWGLPNCSTLWVTAQCMTASFNFNVNSAKA